MSSKNNKRPRSTKSQGTAPAPGYGPKYQYSYDNEYQDPRNTVDDSIYRGPPGSGTPSHGYGNAAQYQATQQPYASSHNYGAYSEHQGYPSNQYGKQAPYSAGYGQQYQSNEYHSNYPAGSHGASSASSAGMGYDRASEDNQQGSLAQWTDAYFYVDPSHVKYYWTAFLNHQVTEKHAHAYLKRQNVVGWQTAVSRTPPLGATRYDQNSVYRTAADNELQDQSDYYHSDTTGH